MLGSGLGRGCVLAYAVEGVAGILIADINKHAAESVATESLKLAANPNYRALTLQVDVTKEEDVNAMVHMAIKEFGRIDYAVNSAGVGLSGLSTVSSINATYMLTCWRDVDRRPSSCRDCGGVCI